LTEESRYPNEARIRICSHPDRGCAAARRLWLIATIRNDHHIISGGGIIAINYDQRRHARSHHHTVGTRQPLDAAAAYHHLPASDYLGLDAGTTYYAFDPSTERFYAAAGLDASPNSLQAQIGTQDDGAYNLFSRAAGTSAWTAYDDGLGAAQDSTCPIAIPVAVFAAWNGKANSCYPPS
jgi:hypothetical protein